MKKPYLFFPFLMAGLFPVFLNAQSAGAAGSGHELDSMMNIYANSYPQEKIHIQFDKSIYSAGETIWFKAYIFSGADPSIYSKNFYAELSDPSGAILERKIYPIGESSAAGNFDLPGDLKARHLHFRAYTTWMANFDTTFYFEKDIRIYDEKRDSPRTVTPVPRQTLIQFFPEGGDLVAEVKCGVAFKANDQGGLPVEVKGMIVDQSGKELLLFGSEHDGMGKFLVTPDKGDSLTAIWKDEQGIEHHTGLPSIKSAGAVLHVTPGKEKVVFSIARSAEGTPEYKHLTIIAHMYQHLVYKARINLEDNFMSGGIIPTGQLPTGVLQLTVFTSDMQPVAERIVFVNNQEYLFHPEITVPLKGMAKRGKNSLVIDVPDTLRSNLSLSITDATADGEFPADDNIISRLLLTGELKGTIHNPYYYFMNPSDSLAGHLDLVMLTHGWRRFKWDQVVRGQLPVIKNPGQDYLSVIADIRGVDTNRISKNESVNVILTQKDSSKRILSLPYLSGAKFGVTWLVFFDTAKVTYTFGRNKDLARKATVQFNTGLPEGPRTARSLTPPVEDWPDEDSVYLRENRYIAMETERVGPAGKQKAKTLATATVRAWTKTPEQKLNEQYASSMFKSINEKILDVEDDRLVGSYSDIWSYLQGKVAGLGITPSRNPNEGPRLNWRGSMPDVYVNEMKIDTQHLYEVLNLVALTDVAMVKAFPSGSGVGYGGGADGVIAIYTKAGGDQPATDPGLKGPDRAILIGYAAPKEFYSPDYPEKSSKNEQEDLRTTLYWKPFLLTDKDNRKMTVEFFNNDITKNFRVVLEGINEDGKLTHIEQIIQ